MPTVEERLEAHDRLLGHLSTRIDEIIEGQSRASALIDQRAAEGREQIAHEAAAQRQLVADEGARVTGELLKQSQNLVALSQAMVTLRAEVSKWAAGGSLVGAVILFIAVRGLGF